MSLLLASQYICLHSGFVVFLAIKLATEEFQFYLQLDRLCSE